MGWTRHLSRTPTWPTIASQFLVGLVFVTLAVLDATRFADQVETHGDALMAVAMAVVGGLAIGAAFGLIRQRAAVRQGVEVDAATSA